MANFGIIVLRGLNTGTLEPNLPNGWECILQDSKWFTLYSEGVVHSSSLVFHAHLELSRLQTAQGVYSVFATDRPSAKFLYNLAQSSANAWTLKELRADNTQPAATIKNLWLVSGSLISGTSTPCIANTIAGYTFHDDAESYSNLAALSASASVL